MVVTSPSAVRKRRAEWFAAALTHIGALWVWLLLWGAAGAHANDPAAQQDSPKGDRSPVVRLEPVVVTAARLPSESSRVPAAVTVVDQDEFVKGRPATKLDDALVRVPGVFVQNETNFAQDLRISMRGFGARSAFGIRGIQVYVDGIPQTLPDGQTSLDTIEPEAIDHIEVLRGPVSALFGNASGGVVNIITREGPQQPLVQQRTVLGEYGLWKTVLDGGGQAGRLNAFGALSHLETEGYREHSAARTTIFNSKLRVDIDDYSDLTMLFNGLSTPRAQDPGGLTAEQSRSDPRKAAQLNRLYDTGEEIEQQRAGLIYRRALTNTQNLEVAGFFSRRDLESAIPFRFIDLERWTAGGRIQHDFSGSAFSHDFRTVSGIELQRQSDDRLNSDNIAGEPGETLLLSQDEIVTGTGLYLQQEIDLTQRWAVVLGGRYDQVRFEIDDGLGDDSGARTFDQLSGRTGLLYSVSPDTRLYANIAQSFETPTTTEVVNRPGGGGGINPDIEPQTAVNYEVGLKTGAGSGLVLEAALFYIELEDELIAFRDASDRAFYRNAGKSRRLGAEVGIRRFFGRHWQALLSYSFMKAEFEAYEKQGRDLSGKEVPGLPEHRGFAELRYARASGFYGAAALNYVDEFYVDDENTIENEASAVTDLRLGYEAKARHWRFEPFAGIGNLFDERYNSNVRINANGGRYFEPAPGRNYYAGIRISYHWD